MRRVVFKILVIMDTVRIVLYVCKTWKFRVTHFAIFHYYELSTAVRRTWISVHSMHSVIHVNMFYVNLLSNIYKSKVLR
jgi:hypothetical protein